MKQHRFETKHWKYGYLVDTIFTRDPWMHRLDISRATGRMVLTAQHEGRLIANAVAEWARRQASVTPTTCTARALERVVAEKGLSAPRNWDAARMNARKQPATQPREANRSRRG